MSGIGETLQASPLLAIVTLFGAGVLASALPCIWPMIPITASVIGGSRVDGTPRSRVVGLTLAYVLGTSLLYATLGLIAGMTGHLFGTISANKWVLFAVGNVMLLCGLAMLDVIPVAAPQKLLAWAGSLGGGSYPAVFLLGATSGIVMAPCGAPAFAAVLTWVATTKSGLLGFVYLFSFSLGMCAVLVAVGLGSGLLAHLPRAGRWMVWLKKLAGVILLGMAEYYFVRMGTVL